MNLIAPIINYSRPRFWTYSAGTFLVGYTLASGNVESMLNPVFLTFLIFFLPFSNWFIYGINDWFDQDTDQFNFKKIFKEQKLVPQHKKTLLFCILASLIFSLLLILTSSFLIKLLLINYLALAYAYSAPPFRFKARPILDFISNCFYIIPGLVGYNLITNDLPPTDIIIGFVLWTWAMHLFSAIPDIQSDRKAHLKTTAVVLGKILSLILCLIFWLVFSIIAVAQQYYFPLTFLSIIYPSITAILLIRPKVDIEKVYWYFPWINGILGFVVFLISVLYR